jgi:hypothetical protein
MKYKLLRTNEDGIKIFAKIDNDGLCRLTCSQNNPQFRSDILNQQPGGAVVEDGDSFSLNTSPNDSILEDADGNVMTIDEAKAYVRTLP